jgi:hypothetical protein
MGNTATASTEPAAVSPCDKCLVKNKNVILFGGIVIAVVALILCITVWFPTAPNMDIANFFLALIILVLGLALSSIKLKCQACECQPD